MYFVEPDADLSPIACAYIRARGADRLCSYGDWAALSDVCDAATARYLKLEVSDGIIAPGYTDEALEILKTKKKGNYNVVQIDPAYVPAPQEYKDVFGVTFQQGRNNFAISEDLLNNIVTENKDLPAAAKRDMIVALITLKYTQSNSVCYVKDGQAIGVGAGQQSRIHCTRLAGSKADTWWLRHHPKVLGLQFVESIRRPDRDNAIDVYLSDEYEDVLAEGVWQQTFAVKPEVLTAEEKKAWIATLSPASPCGSDAFFPFGDNVERARKSGVAVHRRARRLHPGRQRHRHGQQVRHDHVLYRHAAVPSLRLRGLRSSRTFQTEQARSTTLRIFSKFGVGGGGREHAIIKKLKENPAVETIYALPGNGGIAADAVCVPEIAAKDIDAIVDFAASHAIGLRGGGAGRSPGPGRVWTGSTPSGIPCFGPDAKAARIEASKVFAKDLMKKYHIPTARL